MRPAPPLVLAISLLTLTAACARGSKLPEGEGRGLVSWDRTAPAGAELFERPDWKVGDRFSFRNGDAVRLAFRVADKGPDGYELLEEESGVVTLLTLDLGEKGELHPETGEVLREIHPADHQFSWPLWVGKRWTCHLFNKRPGAAGLPLLVEYQCDGIDEITVPAGTFRALRIWRRARVAAKGDFLERVTLLWFAPEVGFFVRRLSDGWLTELDEFHRQ